jgi:hypothetical protein
MAPTTTLDTQIATAMLVRTEGDIGAKQGALLRGLNIHRSDNDIDEGPDPGRAAPSAGTARRLQSLHPSPINPGRLSAGRGSKGARRQRGRRRRSRAEQPSQRNDLSDYLSRHPNPRRAAPNADRLLDRTDEGPLTILWTNRSGRLARFIARYGGCLPRIARSICYAVRRNEIPLISTTVSISFLQRPTSTRS